MPKGALGEMRVIASGKLGLYNQADAALLHEVMAGLVASFDLRYRSPAPLTRRGSRADVLVNPVWCRPCMLREWRKPTTF